MFYGENVVGSIPVRAIWGKMLYPQLVLGVNVKHLKAIHAYQTGVGIVSIANMGLKYQAHGDVPL